ncbi:MAG TPA: LuxR C-terminal-related transcriptional regulator [Chloroflexota bacterium]
MNAPRRAGRLPTVRSPLIGRADDLAGLSALRRQRDPALVTLTGPGGCGKTRLALASASIEQSAHADGARLVQLASIEQPRIVPNAVAAAVGLSEQTDQPLVEALIERLSQADMLLVVDNCEHLLEAVASLVDQLLSACSGVRVIATSRGPLGVAGEHVWQVPPLTHSDAVELFVDRASSARRTFTLNDHTRAAIDELCLRLDGLPLAIELAAARVNVMAVDQMLAHLDDRRLLATHSPQAEPRQRTLEATIDWSYNLLAEADRQLFRRLAVFAGNWSVDAAERVADGSVDTLARLVDQSLIAVDDLEARHHFLGTIRAYASMRLEESGEHRAMRDSHAAYFGALATDAGRGMLESEPGVWVRRLDDELDNVRLALAWLTQTDASAGTDMAAGLWWFWFRRGLWHEGRRWLETVLGSYQGESPTLVRILTGLGTLSWVQGDYVGAHARLQQSVALGRRLGLDEELAIALMFTSMDMLGQGDAETAKRLVEESVARLRPSRDRVGLGLALASVGAVALAAGDYAGASGPLEESVQVLRALDDFWGLALPLRNRGLVAYREGDLERAADLIRESITTLASPGDPWFGARGLEAMATIAVARGDFVRAARVFGAAEALRGPAGAAVPPYERRIYDEARQQLRGGLSVGAISAAWTHGRRMRPEQAVAYAFGECEEPELNPLSARERDVLDLLTRGLSNRAIAQKLVITEKTTEAHVSNILRKLGVSTRAQAAVWAVQNEPSSR